MTPRHKITLRDYGEQVGEVSWGRSGLCEGKKTPRGESKNREKNMERCKARAKATVRRKVMAAGLDHLLTLTYRENVKDKWRAWADFIRFIRRVHRYFPEWRYVAVTETQERGAIHFHIAVKGYQDVSFLRALWSAIVGEGNIDVQYRESEKGLKWKKAKLAFYLTKYIGKEMEGDLDERRFHASLGIEIPEEVIWIPSQADPVEFALITLHRVVGRIGFMWCPQESHGAYGWACSWG